MHQWTISHAGPVFLALCSNRLRGRERLQRSSRASLKDVRQAHSSAIHSVKLDGPCIAPRSHNLLLQGRHRLEDRVLRLLCIVRDWGFSTPGAETVFIRHGPHLNGVKLSHRKDGTFEGQNVLSKEGE